MRCWTHDATSVARTDLAPASAFLGALGMTGLTAYAGLLKVAEFKPGDAVFVSGAAGAVGSLVGQIAKAMGASRVIGSAGTPEKVARLLELGFDAAFNYHDGPVREQLAKAAGPAGIDVYFDNVGGEHLEAALAVLNVGGRVAMCGAIAQYNSTEPTPGSAQPHARHRQAAHPARVPGGRAAPAQRGVLRKDVSAGWRTVQSGTTRRWWTAWRTHPQAFMDLLDGANTGKMLVRL